MGASLKDQIGQRLVAAFPDAVVTKEGGTTVIHVNADEMATAASRAKEGQKTMAEGNVASDQLRLFIERVERLEEEKKGIADDIRDVYSEAKSQGYDATAMRLMVRLRKMEGDKLQEHQAIATRGNLGDQ